MCATHLFASGDPPAGKDDDPQIALDFDGLGDAVGPARVVDVTGQSAAQGGVDDSLLVQSEHVNAAVGRLVALLPALGQFGPDHFANVLDDHRVFLNVTGGVEAQALDLGAGQVNVVTPLLFHLLVLRTLRVDKLFGIRTRKVHHHQTAGQAARVAAAATAG